MEEIMCDLVKDTTEASAWVGRAITEHSNDRVFGKIISAVIWTDEPGPDGTPVVNVDPSNLIVAINAEGLPMFRGHDPGLPVGRTLAAKLFTSPSGVKFAAAIIGLYEDQQRLSFSELGLDPNPPVSPPSFLDRLNDDCWLDFATDPREVDAQWLDEVLRSAPLRVKRIELSHNAAEPQGELIRIGLVYAALIWNPLVTTIATEAGKDLYAGIRQWLRSLLNKLTERRNPVVELQSYQNGCTISFLFRGKDVKQNYDAHDALSTGAAQAVKLIAGMKNKGVVPTSLVYEFEFGQSRWFPSYAILKDGRIVSDRNILIAIEQLPTGLSIGMLKRKKDSSATDED
jgi:hypothetical protein